MSSLASQTSITLEMHAAGKSEYYPASHECVLLSVGFPLKVSRFCLAR